VSLVTARAGGLPAWRWTTALVAACLVLLALAGPVPPAGADAAPPELIGGRSWYGCAALAVGKWFFVTNPAVFAAMAIAGGLACGFGF
jgi:hypothetical protein